MLLGLSIRDVVLIDRLDLQLEPGLCVLTGETGAGKSILLDSLGLVTGARGDSMLVRGGAKQSSVSAEFRLEPDHPVFDILNDQGLENDSGELVLRRTLGADGRSRAFVNDQPVSVGLLRRIGDSLVEVHGQHGERGLLNVANHRDLLDAFGGLGDLVTQTRDRFTELRRADAEFHEAREKLAAARADEDYLRHVVAELAELDPGPDEEEALAEERQLGMHAEKVMEELSTATALFEGEDGIESRLRRARGKVERAAEKAAGRLDNALASVERADIETAEAASSLADAVRSLEFDPARLEQAEERLFALRALARKHKCAVRDLPQVREKLSGDLAALTTGAGDVEQLGKAAEQARKEYDKLARELGARRREAAKRLDKAVAKELPPLKLEKARFVTCVNQPADAAPASEGLDRVVFQVATNPGAEPGPLSRIASGGELSRFMLALKLVLAREGTAPTLVFDEIDRGIGGAVADAVGERLAKLAARSQILVVTHSPQVAARAASHWRVEKSSTGNGRGVVTMIEALDADARRDEIARMLAGAQVTDEARAAAASLIEG